MSYRYKRKKNTKWRNNLMRNLVSELFIHEKLQLEYARAKEVRRQAEKLITLAKKNTLDSKRRALRYLRPLTTKDDTALYKKLFDDIGKRYANREGGYTRVLRLVNRAGDNAPLALIELV